MEADRAGVCEASRDAHRRRPQEQRGTVGARRHRARLRHGLSRRHRRQRRPAGHRPRPERVHRGASVDPQRLPPGPRLADSSRRCARRSVWPPTSVRHRGRHLHRRVSALRDRPQLGHADRRAPAGGRRGRAAHTRQPGDDRGQFPALGPGARDRCLVGPHRGGIGGRPALGRLPRRCSFLARRLSPQSPARRIRGDPRPTPSAGESRPRCSRPAGPGRSGPRGGWPGRHDLRPDRRARWRPHPGCDRGDRRSAGAGRVRDRRAPRQEPDAAPDDLLLAPVRRGQPRHVRGVRRDRRLLLPLRLLLADLDGLLADPGGRRDRAADPRHVDLLRAIRCSRSADRAAHSADGRTAIDCGGACC